jgi:aminopeptidase YwaD
MKSTPYYYVNVLNVLSPNLLGGYIGKEQLELDGTTNSCTNIVRGQPWYAGDHAIFAFGGTKCIVIYTSDLFEECLSYTHCPKDTIDLVDEKLIENAAEYICKVVNAYK